MKRTLAVLLLLATATAVTWGALQWRSEPAPAGPGGEERPVPVEVGPVERGPITSRRTFSGALEAAAEFVVAPKVSGRVARIAVDLGDEVRRGQVLAWLDDDELVQAVRQAEADLAVARANRAEAAQAHELAARALQRVESLIAEGVASASQLDEVRAEEVAGQARVEVTLAEVARAEAALETARIRLQYASVAADWSGPDDARVVGERFVDEGENVSANTPLLSIVELDPIVAVVYVPERDYARLTVGQEAALTTDAFPGVVFDGRVSRIAPVFRSSTRQARVELVVANADERLKPGLFVRVRVDLERIEEATIVPFDALAERDGVTGVFRVDEDGARVRWLPVEPGVREGTRVAVRAEGLAGRVVTLGQALCDDGSRVRIFEAAGLAGDSQRR